MGTLAWVAVIIGAVVIVGVIIKISTGKNIVSQVKKSLIRQC